MRFIRGRRQNLALLAGVAVWAAIFAGGFTCAVFLVESASMAYFYLLFLPQVVASVAGAAVYVGLLPEDARSPRSGQRFAVVTCVIVAFAGALATMLLDHEMPGGWGFVEVLALVFVIAAVFDCLVALLGGAVVDRVAGRDGER